MDKWAQLLEDAIIGKVIAALVENSYRIEISDQDGGGLFVYAAEYNGHKPCDGYAFWVRLTLGNGMDVITDYTTNLEKLMAPINAFAASFQT